jgi:hypothetical protein
VAGDLERHVAAHQQPYRAWVVPAHQQACIADATLLPLSPRLVEPEQFCALQARAEGRIDNSLIFANERFFKMKSIPWHLII